MYACSSFGVTVLRFSSGVLPILPLATPPDRPEGLGARGDLVGDPGRLANVFKLGVAGVLDGLSIKKFRKTGDGGVGSPLRRSLIDLFEPVLKPVGTDGNWNAGLSSKSASDGNFASTSDRLGLWADGDGN